MYPQVVKLTGQAAGYEPECSGVDETMLWLDFTPGACACRDLGSSGSWTLGEPLQRDCFLASANREWRNDTRQEGTM